ncbi:Esterase CG5412 [Gryllus bimaculatus]|nr:Esterase CG5412 [Gryllus bimaculatus]
MQAGDWYNGVQTMTNPANNATPLRVLCIHGYRQNGEIFRQKTGSLRKLLKLHVDFVYVTAPNEISSDDEACEPKEAGEQGSFGQRGWWFTNENNTFESKKLTDMCVGLEKSVAVIDTAFKEQGPFDGILGFSQGASFVSLLCGMYKKEIFQHKIKFAIMIAGFKSRCSLHDMYYDSIINIPTLHIFGETDQVIPQEMSQDLLQYFEDPVIITHPGGHYVPATKSQKQSFLDFINSVRS